MLLSDKIRFLIPSNTIEELDAIVTNGFKVSITWEGKRVVSFPGFEGVVEIDELAKKYLKAPLFTFSSQWPFRADPQGDRGISIEERLKYDDLRLRIKRLYKISDAALSITHLYGSLVKMLEYIPSLEENWMPYSYPMPRDIIERSRLAKLEIFLFTPEEYQRLRSTSHRYISGNFEDSNFVANRRSIRREIELRNSFAQHPWLDWLTRTVRYIFS